MTEDELTAARERLDSLRRVVRNDLADDLGGDPEDYDATRHPVPDGGS